MPISELANLMQVPSGKLHWMTPEGLAAVSHDSAETGFHPVSSNHVKEQLFGALGGADIFYSFPLISNLSKLEKFGKR